MAEQLKIQTSVYLAQKMRNIAQSNLSTAGSIDLTNFGLKPGGLGQEQVPVPAFNNQNVQDPNIHFENDFDNQKPPGDLGHNINQSKSQGNLSRNFAFDDEQNPK